MLKNILIFAVVITLLIMGVATLINSYNPNVGSNQNTGPQEKEASIWKLVNFNKYFPVELDFTTDKHISEQYVLTIDATLQDVPVDIECTGSTVDEYILLSNELTEATGLVTIKTDDTNQYIYLSSNLAEELGTDKILIPNSKIEMKYNEVASMTVPMGNIYDIQFTTYRGELEINVTLQNQFDETITGNATFYPHHCAVSLEVINQH